MEKRQNARLAKYLSLFLSEFNKFNNTRTRMLDSIYHRTLKLIKNAFLARKRQDFDIFYATL